jgi:hypothetical protein
VAASIPTPTHHATSGGLKIHNKAGPEMTIMLRSATRNLSAALSGVLRSPLTHAIALRPEVIAGHPHKWHASVPAAFAAPQTVHVQA